ncbi:MAG TPA: glycosyl transferase family 4 [archaeon]|nr:glycosyl transferase family 4 [archaeon]
MQEKELLSFAGIFFAAFGLTYFITPILIRKMSERGLIGKDMNKLQKPEVAELGGISILLGVSLGVITALFLTTYSNFLNLDLTILLASFLTIFFVGFIGVIDDLIGWKKGIRQWQHALFPIFAALPLMAIQAGTDYLVLPFFGPVSIGIFYSLILVPIGVTGASNAFNMLAGFNGLEAGLGIIIISTLTLIAFLTGQTEATILGLSIIGALIAFIFYNWFPAKVFGGDSLTLMIGASIAVISIIGNMEKIGITLIALHWIELLFKAKHKFQSENFGIPQKDGTLKPDPRGGSLTHFVMRLHSFTEKQLVLVFLSIQTLISITVLLLFSFALF